MLALRDEVLRSGEKRKSSNGRSWVHFLGYLFIFRLSSSSVVDLLVGSSMIILRIYMFVLG